MKSLVKVSVNGSIKSAAASKQASVQLASRSKIARLALATLLFGLSVGTAYSGCLGSPPVVMSGKQLFNCEGKKYLADAKKGAKEAYKKAQPVINAARGAYTVGSAAINLSMGRAPVFMINPPNPNPAVRGAKNERHH